MGIWIRSQGGKKLVNVNELWRDTKSIYGCHNTSEDAGFILGSYFSVPEAIAVMDMMQEHINLLAYVQYMESSVDFVPPVFQMPPAEFSEEHGGD